LGWTIRTPMRTLNVVVNDGADAADDLGRVFEALANEHRREIIRLLALQPRSISQLAELRGLSLPAIHKHVIALEDARMVRRRKLGRTTFLALERGPLLRLQGWVDQFHPWWGTDAETLENHTAFLGRDPASTEGSM
jgi:DNA-binding transcriptional ArsR family regulator